MDYDVEPVVYADTAEKLKLVADPLRAQILDLVCERAATVGELAAAVDRPPSSVAYHVDLLVQHGFLKVVRTRRVRAIDERFYGRTARTIVCGPTPRTGQPRIRFLVGALAEAERAPSDTVQATVRHARIPDRLADEFFQRVNELAEEFSALERSGDAVYGFVAAVYPSDAPVLPPQQEG